MEMKIGNTEDLKQEEVKIKVSMLMIAQNQKEQLVRCRIVTQDGPLSIIKNAVPEKLFDKPYMKLEKDLDVKIRFINMAKGNHKPEMKLNCETVHADVYIPMGNLIDITVVEGEERDGLIEILQNYQHMLNHPEDGTEKKLFTPPEKKIILPGQ